MSASEPERSHSESHSVHKPLREFLNVADSKEEQEVAGYFPSYPKGRQDPLLVISVIEG